MFNCKLRKIQKQALTDKINEIIASSGYSIELFIIDHKHFGNIILKLVCKNRPNLKFITDRGDIYLNANMLCLITDYHITGFYDTPLKLLQLLQHEITKI